MLHCLQYKKGYKVKHKVPLNTMTINDIPDTELLKNAFKISWPKDHSWLVSANSSSEKKGWVEDIKRSITESKQKH